jgi:DNA-binding transcriptional ArsR family regulator
MARPHRDRSLDYTLIALADGTRREILRRLARTDARVTDLAAPFSISLNSVSKHIKLLERARLVKRRRAGREHILRFRPEPLRKVQQWVCKQEAFWRAGLEAMSALLNEEDKSRSHSHGFQDSSQG